MQQQRDLPEQPILDNFRPPDFSDFDYETEAATTARRKPPPKPRKPRAPKRELPAMPYYADEEEEKVKPKVRTPKRAPGLQPPAGKRGGASDRERYLDRLRAIENWAAATRQQLSGSFPKRQASRKPSKPQDETQVFDYESGSLRSTGKSLGRGRGRGPNYFRL